VADFKFDLFRHQVSNFINARFEGIDDITGKAVYYYYNLDEIATSTGAGLSSVLGVSENIDVTVGAFALSPKFANGETLPFINRWGLNSSATYKNHHHGFEFNMRGEINGPMVVETVLEDGSIQNSDSPVYTTLNFQFMKDLGPFKLIVGVNNLFDYYQPPLSHGMSEYYWGPHIGREFYGRISLQLNRLSFLNKKATVPVKVIDPVCGMRITSENSLKAEHEGRTYYFCAEQCREDFLMNPHKYHNE
jgi:YHS domain-containing protein